MFSIGEKLKQLRLDAGFSQSEIAEKINITKPTYAAYEKGKDISIGTLIELSNIYNVSFTYFFNEVSDNSKMIKIPIISRVSAGLGIFGVEDILDWLEIPESLCKKCDYATFIKGNSMEPKIYDGDLILVRKTEVLENGDIGIFKINDDIFCKKIYTNPLTKEFYLKSLNTHYSPIEISETDTFAILGKVVCKIDYNF